MINSLEKYGRIYWKYSNVFTHLNAIRHCILYYWTLLDKNILKRISEASVSIITAIVIALKMQGNSVSERWSPQRGTGAPRTEAYYIYDVIKGPKLIFCPGPHKISRRPCATVWHLVALDSLIAIMKCPGTYWVWVNCSCHNIGLDESIAVIWSLALDQNGSKVVCIFSGICGTRWAYGLLFHSQPVVRFR